MRIGSLCSGYGGLDMGVQAVLGGEVVWHVEYDKAPSKILAHHWPTVPNHGDLTALDWASLPPIDVLTAGYPCQPFSIAGKRKGADDERHLWPHIKDAIRVLRPRLVVLENVRGHLTLGFGRVLGDLAELGYDTRWVCVRAADAGAPHGRARVFVVAYPEGQPWGFGNGNDVRAGSGTLGREQGAGRGAVEDPDSATLGERRVAAPGEAEGGRARTDSGGRGRTSPTDASGRRLQVGAEQHRQQVETPANRSASREHVDRHFRPADTAWREYAPAIRRWEHVIGRLAPAPTNADGRAGNHRLSARFVEWMMGLPEGHVTDPAIGLTRAQQLKALGNGVVPQQAAMALRMMLEGVSGAQ